MLVDRARRFIEGGHPEELQQILADCVAAGNSDGIAAVQLLARDMYGGVTYSWELKAPAAYCLLAWGQSGLEALVENALSEPTTENFSLAFQLLANAAEGHVPKSVLSLVSDSQITEAVSRAVADANNLNLTARGCLRGLMLSIDDDDEVALYISPTLMSFIYEDSSAIRNLSHALALRSIAVGPKVLQAYDELIADKGGDEPAFQRFFEDHPVLLDPGAFQVWGQPDFHGRFEPDFIIRTYDNRYLVVEIETPNKMLVTNKHRLSAETTHAISQMLRYQGYLSTHLDAASQTFPEFTVAAGLVVIGRESSLTDEQKALLRSENQSRSNVRIVGFDALSATAKAVTENVVHGIPGAIKHARLT